MRHRSPRLLTVLSTVALALLSFHWLTSYYRWRVFSDHGQVLLLVVEADADVDHWLRVKPPSPAAWRNLRTGGARRLAGFELDLAKDDDYRYRYFAGTQSEGLVKLHYGRLALPYWGLVSVAAVAPLATLRTAARGRARRRAGRCVTCGYDLRGAPGNCPVCGAAAAGAGAGAAA